MPPLPLCMKPDAQIHTLVPVYSGKGPRKIKTCLSLFFVHVLFSFILVFWFETTLTLRYFGCVNSVEGM